MIGLATCSPMRAEAIERIREQLAVGSGIIKTAKLIGCGVGTVTESNERWW